MSRRNSSLPTTGSQHGFTLVELTVTLTLTVIIALSFYAFFKTNLLTYLNLQSDASNFTDAAAQSQRISSVVRGLTDVSAANDTDLQVYAYFFPSDTYVSIVHYYLNAGGNQLLVDVTPMTANPPIGTPITASKKTYTIIANFKQVTGTKLFVYLDASDTAIVTPVTDLASIKAVKINVTVPAANGNADQVVSTQVSLRNRKTNL